MSDHDRENQTIGKFSELGEPTLIVRHREVILYSISEAEIFAIRAFNAHSSTDLGLGLLALGTGVSALGASLSNGGSVWVGILTGSGIVAIAFLSRWFQTKSALDRILDKVQRIAIESEGLAEDVEVVGADPDGRDGG